MRGEGGMPAPGTDPNAPAPPSWIGLIVSGVMFLFGLFGCVATGLAAAMAHESDAMTVAYVGVPLALAGVVAPIVAAIVRTQQPAVAIGAPVGCGCATFVVGVVGIVVFFTAIWPSL